MGSIIQHDLHIEWIPFVQNVNLFMSKATAATFAMSCNEYFSILAIGIMLELDEVFRSSDLGYDGVISRKNRTIDILVS